MRKYLIVLLLLVPFSSFSQTTASDSNKIADKYYKEALSYYQQRSMAGTVLSLKDALKVVSKGSELHIEILTLRATVYKRMNRLDDAIVDMQELIRLQPADTRHRVNLGYLYGESKRYTESLEVLEKAKAMAENDPDIYVSLSYYNGEVGAFDNVIKYAEKGLALARPKDSLSIGSLMNNLGYAQAKKISPKKGIETITKSLSFTPDNPYAYINLGRIYLDINDKEKACLNFKKGTEKGTWDGVMLADEYMQKNCK